MEVDVKEEMDDHTHDGTLDNRGKPANRRSTGGFRSSFFILANQGLICISLYGIAVNLVIYLTEVLREGDSSAATNTSNWQGAQYFFSCLGGFLGDAYLGRYLASNVFQLIFIAGVVLVALTATLPSLRPPACGSGITNCQSASKSQIGLFYSALYIIALGYGGYQPNVLSFGADQFDEENSKEKVGKLQFFNWFYAALTLGTLFSSTLLAYIENEAKWALGFWISAGACVLAFGIFLAPTKRYRYHKAGGNPLSRIAQVVVGAIRKRHVTPPESEQLYEVTHTESAIAGSRKILHTKTLRFFDKAATITDTDFDRDGLQVVENPWRLCTVTQVEELKWLCRMLPVWACTIFYTTAYTQVYSLFVIQGAAMDTMVGGFNVPPAGLYAVDCVTVVVCVVAYNYWLLPCARRWTGQDGGFTSLQRIGLGMPIVALAMVEAGLVEMVRRHTMQRGGGSISVLWQIPQYITTGVSETFTYIGQMHFFYDQAPDAMRSMGSALPQLSVAIGSYVNSLLIVITGRVTGSPGWLPDSINEGHLDYFFYLLAILSMLNLGLFGLSSLYYKYTSRQELSPCAQAEPFLLPLDASRAG